MQKKGHWNFIPPPPLFWMGFAHLVNSNSAIKGFEVMFGIENDRWPGLIFLPLMVMLEGGVRFPLDHFLLKTLNFYKLSLN